VAGLIDRVGGIVREEERGAKVARGRCQGSSRSRGGDREDGIAGQNAEVVGALELASNVQGRAVEVERLDAAGETTASLDGAPLPV